MSKYTYRRSICALFWGALLIPGVPGAWAQTAQVSGQVVNAINQAAVSGAHVSLIRVPDAGSSSFTPSTSRAITDTAGKFQVSGLAAGSYQVCIVAPMTELLNPCQWSSTPPKVTVAAGQTVSGLAITLVKGHTLLVKVTDPSGLLEAAAQKSADALSLHITGHAAGLSRMTLLSKDSSGRYYMLPVAYNQPLKILVHSASLSLASAVGTVSPAASQVIPFQVAPGDRVDPISIQVTGLALAQ